MASSPCVQAVSTRDNVLVAADNCLLVFSPDCAEVTPIVFRGSINTFSVSPCCRFLTAGLQNGSMQFVYLPLRKVLSGQSICEGLDHELGSTFSCSLFTGAGDNSSMSLISASGSLYTFSNINLDNLDKFIKAGDVENIRGAQNNIVSSVTEVGEGVVKDCLHLGYGDMLLTTDRGLVRDMKSQDYLQIPGCIKTLTSKCDPTFILSLDRDGSVHIICPLTLIIIYSWKLTSRASSAEAVKDLVIIEDEGSTDIKLLAVTHDSIRDESCLLLLDFPSFNVTYRLSVSWFTKLVSPHLSQDTPLVLEGSAEDVLRPDLVSRLKMRGICEGVPEARLARLLKRLKFDEAEKFAASFNLDKEQIYHARASWLLNFLSPWKPEDPLQPHSKVIRELETTLTKMTDLNFVVDLCVTAAAPSLAMTRDLLNFARRKIENNPEDVSERLLLRVGQTLHRLETFVLIQTGGEGEVEMDTWMEFTRASMLTSVENLISRGDLERARLLWIRHQAEFKDKLDVALVSRLLEIIPETVEAESILAWLAQLIPDCLTLVPDSLPAVSSWAVRAVTRLELSKRAAWPQSGLLFARAVLDTMTFSRSSSNTDFTQFMTLLTLNQQRIEPDSPLSQLINIIKSLEDLLVLHKQFRIKLKLSEFTDPVKFNVISLILDWVNSAKEISTLMDAFLTNYLIRSDLDINKTLTEYILAILDNTSFTWHWHIGSAPWEEKVATLVQYITNVEDKSEVILEAVKNAPVPWSEVITDLCEVGTKLQHRNSVLIKEQESLVHVKTILRKYDCKSYITSGRQADRLLVLLMRKGGEEGFRDALDVCNVVGGKTEFEMEKLYVQHLLEDKQDALTVLERIHNQLSLSLDQGVDLCRYIVDTAKMIVKMEVDQRIEASYMEAVRTIMASLKSFKKTGNFDVPDIIQKAETLVRANSLKTDFGLLTQETSLEDTNGSITNPDVCRKLLWSFLENETSKFEDGSEGSDDKVRLVYNKIKKLCDILKLEQDEAMAGLVLKLERLGHMEAALNVADIIKTDAVSVQLAESFYSVLYRLTGSGQGDLGEVTSKMMNQSLTFCSDSSLADCLDLATWTGLETRVHQESSDKKAFTGGHVSDVYTEWRFSHVYTDKGLPLEGCEVTPLTQGCMTSVLPLVDTPPLPYLPRSRAANVEVQDLDVTAPDLESLGNGVDAVESCNKLASQGHDLVGQLQMAGHVMMGLSALQVTDFNVHTLKYGAEFFHD